MSFNCFHINSLKDFDLTKYSKINEIHKTLESIQDLTKLKKIFRSSTSNLFAPKCKNINGNYVYNPFRVEFCKIIA